jgi:Protein kinase domain
MEYLDGGSVHDRLRDGGRVPPGQALEWLGQAAVALDRAHAEGVVHRDVKPANLLLDRDGSIVVSDFGIASTTGVDTLTLPGTVLGTAGYLSPEQARGEPASAASDRYGLGVVAFELLTGRRPYEAETAATEAFAHVNAPVPSAEKIYPELPDGVDEVLERALAKDPEDRPATAVALVSELRDAFRGAVAPTRVAALAPVAGTGQATRRQTHTPTPVPRRPRNRGLVLGAAGFLVAGLVLAALLGAILDPDGPKRQAAERQPSTSTETQTQTQTTGLVDGKSLGAAGFALMEDGDYQNARPLLLGAVKALRGSGLEEEAWALYNLAYTRYQLGECAGISTLLGRSERIQGRMSDIDALRRATYDRCVGGGDSGGDDD